MSKGSGRRPLQVPDDDELDRRWAAISQASAAAYAAAQLEKEAQDAEQSEEGEP